MDAWGYFTPAREEEFCWNRTTEKPPRAGSSPPLSGPEAKRFYESLTKGDDEEEERRRRRRKNHREQEGGRRRDGDRKAEGRGGGALGGGGRRDGGEEPGQQVQSGNVRTIKVERRDDYDGGGQLEGNRRREGGTSERRRRRRRSSRERRTHAPQGVVNSSTTELQGLKLLRCAQEGDLSGLKEQLSRGADINFQDTFFWTAVMCASWSGQRPAVRLLLQRGAAWVGVVDTKGRDARDLALAAGHQGVLEELESYGRSPQQDTQPDARRSHQQPPQQCCEVCGVQYSSSLSSHLSSTLHQFNLRRPPPTPQYCLPASSASYKMMLRCGWNPSAGLGPEGEGPRQPVPTVLKRDHKGLGYGPAKRAKVTHFPAKDPKAVKKVLPEDRERRKKGDTGKSKGVARREEEREKCWERDFRNSFHIV